MVQVSAAWLSTGQQGPNPAIGLGAWPDWIAAVASSLAFMIAAVAFARGVAMKRRANASLVYAESEIRAYPEGQRLEFVDPELRHTHVAEDLIDFRVDGLTQVHLVTLNPLWHARVTVHNVSDELMGPVSFRLAFKDSGEVTERWRLLQVLRPGDSQSVLLLEPWDRVTGGPFPTVETLFRDSSGAWWLRVAGEPVRRYREPKWVGRFWRLALSRLARASRTR